MRYCFRSVLSIEIAALCMTSTKCVALAFHRGLGKCRHTMELASSDTLLVAQVSLPDLLAL